MHTQTLSFALLCNYSINENTPMPTALVCVVYIFKLAEAKKSKKGWELIIVTIHA